MPGKTEMRTNFYRNMVLDATVGMMNTPGVMSSRVTGTRTGTWTGTIGIRAAGIPAIGVSVIGVRQLSVWAPPVRMHTRIPDRICGYESWLARARFSCRVRRETRRAALFG